MAVAAKPGHAKDTIVRILKRGDDEVGIGGCVVEAEADIKEGGTGGAIESRYNTVGGVGIPEKIVAAGKAVAQDIVSGARVDEKEGVRCGMWNVGDSNWQGDKQPGVVSIASDRQFTGTYIYYNVAITTQGWHISHT